MTKSVNINEEYKESVLHKKNDTGIVPFIKKYYDSYRGWQKKRGRLKKDKKLLKERVEFYTKFIRKGDLCFDIGANIGTRTEAFLELGARVIAVEPQKQCSQILQAKFSDNQNFILVEKALDNVKGQKEFYISNANTLSSMSSEWIDFVKKENFFEGSNWDEKTVINTTTMDSLIETYGQPVFCKIDVEGYEYNVLQGLTGTIPVISFEFTKGLNTSISNCVQYLSNLGNNLFNYSIGESMSLALPEWVDAEKIIDIILTMPRSEGLSGDIYAKVP